VTGVSEPSHEARAPRSATAVCLALLLLLVVQWLGANAQSSLIRLGERLWPGYGSELRREPEPPVPPAEPPPSAPAPDAERPAAEDDPIAALLAEEDAKQAAAGVPVKSAADEARERHAERVRRYEEAAAQHADIVARRTAAVRAFSAVERGLAAASAWVGGHLDHIFVGLLALCGAVATLRRRHIALGDIDRRAADRVAQGVSLVANGLLLASVVAQWQLRRSAGTGSQDDLLAGLWALTFAGMLAVNLHHLARPLGPKPGRALDALRGVPLYAVMAVLAGVYFLAVERYPAGLAVYLEKLLQSAQLYLHVGLYVWAGMLLKETRLAPRILALLRPLRLSPELLAAIVVTLAAFPTAYSGASGIFVLAAGALIHTELTRAGASPALARAATAMSGSLGVVLSPCLLVMIIAYLDTEVASDELFAWGRWVFALTAALFTAMVYVFRRERARPAAAPAPEAPGEHTLAELLRDAAVFAALLLGCYLAFGAKLDPQSAPVMLPLALVLVLLFDRRRHGGAARPPLAGATSTATVHIGALLMLMALSACLGGAIERSEVVSAMPTFASPWPAMAVLVVVLVLIGMVMDPYGAAILVYATLSKLAYASGIGPVHFWMVVLVAFELGYLTPPVALNHLLARQAIGADYHPPADAAGWRRHEHVLLPIAVMAIALLVVAFGPLLWTGA
jgi:TRAP-type C4-dicarboxylate transport system permease large subunit